MSPFLTKFDLSVDLYQSQVPWLLVLQFQASSAYWRGDKNRESLQRVYGISYPDQKSLKVIFIFIVFSFW